MHFIVSKLRLIHQHNSSGLPELNYATVVEGNSFFKIQQSKRLTECFMQLALSSKVLIGCRLSPKQKAEVITLI
jgi:magnesium-transporting ATPase (P-type)